MIRNVIDGNVIAWLKEPHLANFFGADARSRDVGHGATRKLKARIRGVHLVGENWDPDRVQFSHLNLFANQPLHNIKIVNHQVEHYIDVERARGKLTYAVNFEIDWIAHMRTQRDKRRIKSLCMAHLQNRVAFVRRGNHPGSFVERARNWFLDQYVHARLKQFASDLTM